MKRFLLKFLGERTGATAIELRAELLPGIALPIIACPTVSATQPP